VFERTNGAWSINGQFYNPDVPVAIMTHGVPEIWTIKNGGGGWSHPVHIHFEEFRILLRNGQTPSPEDMGRHDVVELHPNDEVQIYIQFRDFTGRYVMHCHNTVHEDHAMMTRIDITA
jgi:FtsP/CotA-like multicopper oxidase with cupredoxin domain